MIENDVLKRFSQIGFIVLLPGELPNDRVIEICDALLASPVGAVQIVPNGPSTIDTLQTFRARSGEHMLVGADRVESIAELDAIIDAGAQFASSGGDFHLPLLAHARKRNFTYIPTVHSPGQTLISHRAKCDWQKIRDDIDVEGVEGMMERCVAIGYRPKYIVNQVEIEFLDAVYEAGAALACLNDIYVGPTQPMSSIIVRARQARQIWLDQQNKGDIIPD